MKNSEDQTRNGLPDGWRRTNMVINEEQHKELKKQAILQNSKLYMVVYDALKEYLASR